MKTSLILAALSACAGPGALAQEAPKCAALEGSWAGKCVSKDRPETAGRIDIRQSGCGIFRMAYGGFMQAADWEAKGLYGFHTAEFFVGSVATQSFVAPVEGPPGGALAMSVTTLAEWNDDLTVLTTHEYLFSQSLGLPNQSPVAQQPRTYFRRDEKLVQTTPGFDGECVYTRL